jgi:nitrite reductase/ring-hydroxylating ferredoxin subunit
MVLRSCLARPAQAPGSRRNFSTRSASSVTPAISPEMCACWATGMGRAGLLHARCCHRGTTLYYGKVGEDGIRCSITAGSSTPRSGASNRASPCARSIRTTARLFYRVTEAALLTLRVVPNPRVAQFARIADTSFRILCRAGRVKNSGDDTNEASRGKHSRSC